MQKEKFFQWLIDNKYNVSTSKTRIANCLRVSEHEGDLDEHFEKDKCKEVIDNLTYTISDKRLNKSPKHTIPISGDIYKGTATLKQAVHLYIKFRLHCVHINEDINVIKNITDDLGKKEVHTSIKDSYQCFLHTFNIKKDELYEFGLNETIFPPPDKVYEYWDKLKNRIYNNETVYVRGYGRDAKGTELYINLYKHLFNNSKIIKDPTNNHIPQKLIQELTGFKRNRNLFNYQVSHIYGRTKNIFMFEAPWNIVFIPKIIDPLTGHETKGIWPEEYQERFLKKVNSEYRFYIEDFNKLIEEENIIDRIKEYCECLLKESEYPKIIEQFTNDALNEFRPIQHY
jgi:hypothetical protein